jgi:hypothetical protein
MLHVPIYVIYDPFSAQLDAYRLSASRQYEPIAPDDDGRIPCEPLGLSLGIVPGVHRDMDAPWLRWIGKDGQPLYLESERAAREWLRDALESERAARESERAARESERAARESERAARESERADAAEAELAKLRDELKRRG